MRLNDTSLSFVINFLLGVAWATSFLGLIITFFFYFSESFTFTFAIVLSFLSALPGLFGVLILEHIITSRATYIEITKQTKLLEALVHKL